MQNIVQSVLIGLSIAVIPGPIFFELTRRTMAYGFWDGAMLAVGEFMGNFLLLSLIFFGLSPFLGNTAFQVSLYLVGAIILIWLGVNAIRLKDVYADGSCMDKLRTKNSLFVGFGIAVSSPIVIALWFSLAGSYLSKITPKLFAFVNILFITAGFLVFFFSMAAVIHRTRHRVPSRYVVLLSRIFGVVLVGYGLSFLYKFVVLL